MDAVRIQKFFEYKKRRDNSSFSNLLFFDKESLAISLL